MWTQICSTLRSPRQMRLRVGSCPLCACHCNNSLSCVQGGHLLFLQGLVLQLARGLPLWRLPLLRVGGGWVLTRYFWLGCGTKQPDYSFLFMFSSKVVTWTVTTRGWQQWFYATGIPKFLDRALGRKLSPFLNQATYKICLRSGVMTEICWLLSTQL